MNCDLQLEVALKLSTHCKGEHNTRSAYLVFLRNVHASVCGQAPSCRRYASKNEAHNGGLEAEQLHTC